MILEPNITDSIGNAYKMAYPFPYAVIDNFLNEYMLTRAAQEIRNYQGWHYDPDKYVEKEQVNKEFAPSSYDAQSMAYFKANLPITNSIIDYLYSTEALDYLERLTGIEGLIGDPDLLGGGIHRIKAGGKLDVHADFNLHHTRKVWRRINLLLYLNKGWQDEWGGHLELWDRDMSKSCVKVAPIFNRAAIFTITDDAYHGHPYPTTSPPGITRDSIALYYYTMDRPEHEKADWHPVLWKQI
jgi:Rps23 Pro-64 3,4-dihydroxylase Tpa1-like proline 4-hydroxylase